MNKKNFTTYSFITLILLTSFVLLFSCESGSEPEKYKSPAEYSWTADTLSYGAGIQTLMWSIWGSSSDDVYVCGHTFEGNQIYHYDGVKWEVINMLEYGIPLSTKRKVFGFAEDDVWMCGAQGHWAEESFENAAVSHFDGQTWQSWEFEQGTELRDIWGEMPDDVWACGNNGLVMHYNHGAWLADTAVVENVVPGSYYLRNIGKYNGKMYVIGQALIPEFKILLLVLEDEKWKISNSYEVGKSGSWGHRIYMSPDRRMYLFGSEGLFEYRKDDIIQIFKSNEIVSSVSGKDGKLLITTEHHIFFHDGKDLNEVTNLQASGEQNYWTSLYLGNETFVVEHSYSPYNQTTVIYHGK